MLNRPAGHRNWQSRYAGTGRITLRLALTALLLFTLTSLNADIVRAHAGTGTAQFSNEELGPFRIYVWSDPEPPTVGEYHVAVALTENLADDPTGLAGNAILDADVMVTLRHLDGDLELSTAATHEDALNKVFYEAIFNLPESGRWQATVEVASEEGPVSISYQATVQPVTFPWSTVAAAIGSVLLIAAALWLQRRAPTRTDELGTQGVL